MRDKATAALSQVAYLLVYGELPSAQELSRWDEALMRHSAVPVAVEVCGYSELFWLSRPLRTVQFCGARAWQHDKWLENGAAKE